MEWGNVDHANTDFSHIIVISLSLAFVLTSSCLLPYRSQMHHPFVWGWDTALHPVLPNLQMSGWNNCTAHTDRGVRVIKKEHDLSSTEQALTAACEMWLAYWFESCTKISLVLLTIFNTFWECFITMQTARACLESLIQDADMHLSWNVTPVAKSSDTQDSFKHGTPLTYET